MPQGETFWNPYRWVTVSDQPVEHDVPRYHHTSSGLSGCLWCELEALTPLIIGDGRGQFVRHQHHGNEPPYIPATSLKGAMRSLAEVVGNAAVPFPNVSVDAQHELARARKSSHLDTVARTFGYLNKGNVLAGLIHFSDAEISTEVSPPHKWREYRVVAGQPKQGHRAFYLGNNRRKFYHHHPSATRLTPPHAEKTIPVRPAPPGTCFHFTVDFVNLREAELSLLLYCLVLESEVAIELSPKALGPDAQGPVTLRGPLRHKIGGAKPHGAGSVHISIAKMELRTDAMARYRGSDNVDTWEAEGLRDELNNRTASFRGRTDQTMRELRSMLIYSIEDPRKPIHYPQFGWFKDNSQTLLKPTI